MINDLVRPGVVAVEAFADDPSEPVLLEEEEYVAKAVPSRRREFATARRCAREALAELGFPPAPIGVGPGREPLWPVGVVGAITHCPGYRAAAVSTRLAAIGIDAEPDEPLPPGVIDHITAEGEGDMLAGLMHVEPSINWGRLLFSAKESVYKAWYPLMRCYLGYEQASLTIDPLAGTFHARLRTESPTTGGGRLTSLDGGFKVANGLILTAVVVEASIE